MYEIADSNMEMYDLCLLLMLFTTIFFPSRSDLFENVVPHFPPLSLGFDEINILVSFPILINNNVTFENCCNTQLALFH